MEISLPGKVALVTGGASGIGRAISQMLAESGARVAVADINLDAAKEVAEMLGSGAIAIGMDVADEASVAAGFSACRDKLGPLDVLVSNAGIQIIGALDRFSFADWKRLMAVNLDGAFLTTREALRQMYPDRRGGSIIYIGSAHSHMASILKAPYVTAKHGLIGLARAVAKEGGPYNVRSNVVSPALVMTPLIERQLPDLARSLGISEDEAIKTQLSQGTVDGKTATAEDIARIVLFLAAFPDGAMTGQYVNAGHGFVMP